MKSSSLVLLSAGLDSSVNLYKALRETNVKICLTFNYGQKAAFKEIEQAKKIADLTGVEHKVVELKWLENITETTLVNRAKDIPTSMDIDDMNACLETAKSVWVPNRNGVFLNIAAAFADAYKIDMVVPGFNKEEATTFPDNSEAYLQAATQALSYSTSNQVEVKCYTTNLNKTEIVQLGRELGAPFELMWSCYLNLEEPCQKCESCLRFKRAFEA